MAGQHSGAVDIQVITEETSFLVYFSFDENSRALMNFLQHRCFRSTASSSLTATSKQRPHVNDVSAIVSVDAVEVV